MDFTFSQHALSRAIDMALDVDEIVLTLQSPRFRIPSSTQRGCVVYMRDRLAIPVGDGNTVITFLWNRFDEKTRKWMPRFERGNDMEFIRDKESHEITL